jgi:flavin reductase (DIM6/NTAB) family NADH-FMN oxidoreductase RutF
MKVRKAPWTALFPCPVALVTSVAAPGKPNIITLAWVGTVCSDPPMLSLGIRPGRYSYKLIQRSREFVVNIPTEQIVKKVDQCGSVSGESTDKFSMTGLTPQPAEKVKPPLIRECPVNIECVLRKKIHLGVHDLFLGEIVSVHVDQEILDEEGEIDFAKLSPFVFNQGEYWSLGKRIGIEGFSRA